MLNTYKFGIPVKINYIVTGFDGRYVNLRNIDTGEVSILDLADKDKPKVESGQLIYI